VLGWTLAVLAAFVVLSAWFYLLASRTDTGLVNSDAATVLLEGRALLGGNVLLGGWHLTLDSFWSLDAPLFALAIAVAGMRSALLYAVPAVIAALTVAVGCLVAADGRRDRAGLVGAGVVLVSFALPAPTFSGYYLVDPLHQSTALAALVAFYALRRNRFGPGWVLAVVLLVLGTLGDLQMVAYGVVPVLLGGVVAMLRRRSLRAGVPLASAALAALALAEVTRRVVGLLGGFAIGPTQPTASGPQILHNLRTLPSGIAEMFGVTNNVFGTRGAPAGLMAFHAVVALGVGVAFLVALWRLCRDGLGGRQEERAPGHGGGGGRGAAPAEVHAASPASGAPTAAPWVLDDLLVIATFGPAVTYVVLSLLTEAAYLRYLTASLVFAFVLAGRLAARWWARERRSLPRRVALAVTALSAACLTATCVVQVAQPVEPLPAAGLVGFLEAHHLVAGLGDYWSSSITTVASGGKVVVRPVTAGSNGTLEAFTDNDSARWYRTARFRFLVYSGAVGFGGVSPTTAVATWGRPVAVYTVEAYHVLVWDHPLEVRCRFPS